MDSHGPIWPGGTRPRRFFVHFNGDRFSKQGFTRESGLPAAYGADLIVLQPRDPGSLYCYWELRPETVEAARRKLGADGGKGILVLRVYRLTPEGSLEWKFDVEISGQTGERFIPIFPAGESWSVEVGLRTPSSKFIPLARSNVSQTPPAGPIGEEASIWVGLQPEHRASASGLGLKMRIGWREHSPGSLWGK